MSSSLRSRSASPTSETVSKRRQIDGYIQQSKSILDELGQGSDPTMKKLVQQNGDRDSIAEDWRREDREKEENNRKEQRMHEERREEREEREQERRQRA